MLKGVTREITFILAHMAVIHEWLPLLLIVNQLPTMAILIFPHLHIEYAVY